MCVLFMNDLLGDSLTIGNEMLWFLKPNEMHNFVEQMNSVKRALN